MKNLASHGLLAALVTLAAAPVGAAYAQTPVATPQELASAIAAATPGSEIVVAPGEYGSLNIPNPDALTIRGQDPADRPVFRSVFARDGAGLNLEDIVVDYGVTNAPLVSYAVEVRNVDDFRLTGSDVSSSTDGVVGNDAYGVFVRDADRVTIEDNYFHDVFRGVAIFEVSDGVVARNVVTRAASDGVVGRGLIDVEIIENLFTDFQLLDPVAYHPDGVQIWSRGAERGTVGVKIARNVILRGAGDPFQGILVGTSELPAQDVLIENNVVHQSMPQGIYAEAIDGVVVRNNIVVPVDWRHDRPGIDVRDLAGPASVSDNIALAYRLDPAVAASGNVSADFDNPWLAAHIDRLVVAGFEGASARPSDFRAKSAAGAATFVERLGPFTAEGAVVEHDRDPEAPLERVTFPWSGQGAPAWMSESGQTADAADPSMTFTDAGAPKVELLVDDTAVAEKNIRVYPRTLVDLTFDDGPGDTAPEPVSFSGGADSYGAEGAETFGSFNGETAGNGGVFFTFDPSAAHSAAQDLTIEARVRKAPDAGWRMLAVCPSVYEVRINANAIRFSVWNEDGVVKRVVTYNAGINDDAWHDLTLRYSGEDGAIDILVDGVVKAQGFGPGGRLSYQPNRRLYVGGAPWMASVNGDIARFKISR